MTSKAYGLIEKNLLERVGHNYEYKRSNGAIEIIVTKGSLTCSCLYFFDKAMCKHLIAACIIDGIKLPGLKLKVI